MSARRLLLAVPVVLLAWLVPGAAPAQAGTGYTVTIAARYCPTYESITANRARNNIQESLKDLGADTPYVNGQAIDPDIEQASQPLCSPLPDWQFTLGSGYRTRAVSGPWGSLSIVTNPFSTPIKTQASVPLLNSQGQPTGRTLAGATTIELTQEQLNLASRANSLWIQGGTPTDPINNVPFPDEYGFGALRCAIDNLNGDNVEWISYPQGARHVYCFAYYVVPPPTSGTIVVRKEVDAPAGTATTAFRFTGNISFNTDSSFTLNANPTTPGSFRFYRAETKPGDQPWDFTEEVPPGWTLTGLSCTSQTGGSTTSTNLATARTAVTLAAGDTVTCTYRDELVPPKAGLIIQKETIGGLGTFGFDIDGPGPTIKTSATTTAERVPVTATPATDALTPGDYEITERLPSGLGRGKWKLSKVVCDGKQISAVQPVKLTLEAGSGSACLFTNTFTPVGSIVLRKATIGALGTVGFVVTPVNHTPPVTLSQSATTKEEGVPVRATGDDLSKLPLGSYDIQETTPSSRTTGQWSVQSVLCNGITVPSAQGRIRVALTKADPDLDCTFTDRFDRTEPPIPPCCDPDPAPITDLAVTKTASPSTIRVGRTVRYTVVVRNISDVDALSVSVAEQLAGIDQIYKITPSQGRCHASAPPACDLGTMKAGAKATIVALVRPAKVGVLRNRVAVNTAKPESNLRNNVASAQVRVLDRGGSRPAFTG